MSWSIGSAIQRIRESLGLTQKEFGGRLAVTPAYISSIESGRKTPSMIFLKLVCYEYNINAEWIESGKGEPFSNPKQNSEFKKGQVELTRRSSKVISAHLLVTAAILGPIMPPVAAGLALGVGASEIIEKMQKAYGAKTAKELAENYLNVDRTALAHWISKNNVPRKYLEKAAADNHKRMEFFLLQEEATEAGELLVVEFAREQILEVLEKLGAIDSLKGREDLVEDESLKKKLRDKLEKLELKEDWTVQQVR